MDILLLPVELWGQSCKAIYNCNCFTVFPDWGTNPGYFSLIFSRSTAKPHYAGNTQHLRMLRIGLATLALAH